MFRYKRKKVSGKECSRISFHFLFSAFVVLFALQPAAVGQKLIEYTAGMGSRDPKNANIWILYKGVEATHEGMVLFADSAHFNMEQNSLTAYRNVEIQLSDTTTIFGNRLYYDGDSRVLDIWADTVVLIDGKTILKANHLTYDRNQTLAYYDKWGHTVSRNRTLDSDQGYYNSTVKEFYIYDNVRLSDSIIVITTNYLNYNTRTYVAHFETPTYVYSDSSTIYSELGEYNTDTRFAISYRKSHVDGIGWMIDSDTLFYDEVYDYGRAMGNVTYVDSISSITCTGLFGESNRAEHFSYITDSAHVMHIDEYGDTAFIHADTVYMTVDSSSHLQTLKANNHVSFFRRDLQAKCDSAFYFGQERILTMYNEPIIWFDHYQCTADTIELLHDTTGMRLAIFRNNSFTIQQVDRDNFNQLKGKHGQMWFKNGKPDYADVYGNATMVFFITEEEEDSARTVLIGTNVGRGTDIRIYFDTNRTPRRVVTYDKPEMETYPPGQLPEEWRRLPGFNWQTAIRPRKPEDVMLVP